MLNDFTFAWNYLTGYSRHEFLGPGRNQQSGESVTDYLSSVACCCFYMRDKGIEKTEKKIKAILEAPVPINQTQI